MPLDSAWLPEIEACSNAKLWGYTDYHPHTQHAYLCGYCRLWATTASSAATSGTAKCAARAAATARSAWASRVAHPDGDAGPFSEVRNG